MASRIHDTTAAQLVASLSTKKQKVVGTRPTLTVADTLDLLARHDILSLPIYSSYKPDQIVNIVNVKDLLGYLVGARGGPVEAAKAPVEPQCKINIKEAAQKLHQNIEVVMTLDPERESYRVLEVDVNDPLGPVIEAFGLHNSHRGVAVDYQGQRDPFIISQTDILEYIRQNPESLGSVDVLNKTLLDVGICNKSPSSTLFCASEDETVLAAYRKMGRADLLALPVVDR